MLVSAHLQALKLLSLVFKIITLLLKHQLHRIDLTLRVLNIKIAYESASYYC
jgi:hypothetical protein